MKTLTLVMAIFLALPLASATAEEAKPADPVGTAIRKAMGVVIILFRRNEPNITRRDRGFFRIPGRHSRCALVMRAIGAYFPNRVRASATSVIEPVTRIPPPKSSVASARPTAHSSASSGFSVTYRSPSR